MLIANASHAQPLLDQTHRAYVFPRVRIAVASSLLSSRHVRLAFWSAAYALGLPCCDNVSMSERSAKIGVQAAQGEDHPAEKRRGLGVS